MRAKKLVVEGVRGGPYEVDGDGEGADRSSLRAVSLGVDAWGAALHGVRLPRCFEGVGEAEGTTRTERVVECDPAIVRGILEGRELHVDLELEPDPPLFGTLRNHVLRHPNWASGLGARRLRVKVSYRFVADLTFATADVTGFALGTTPIPLAGPESPPWIHPVLAELGSRVDVLDLEEPLDDVIARITAARFGPDLARREEAKRLVRELAEAPFDLPGVDWVRGTSESLIADGKRIGWQGRVGADALRVAEAALLRAPDLLVVPDPLPTSWRAWLEGLTEGEHATLEQVLG